VVVWFGAVAYFLLVLRPASRASGIDRRAWYALLRAIKVRLRRVVGAAVFVVVTTGLGLAHQRGLLSAAPSGIGWTGRVFLAKLVVAGVLIAIFAGALPLIARIPEPRWRARAFVGTHGVVLALGIAAAVLGLLLHG
jgi:uncharacterized membrane protein